MCLSSAYNLLPAGSGQRPRQLNYLGTTLARLGEHLRAESVLMTALHMARDLDDKPSQWHAAARLCFLDNKSNDVRLTRGLVAHPDDNAEYAPAALGYWCLGNARMLFGKTPANRSTREVVRWLDRADEAFSAAHLPFERCWSGQWRYRAARDTVAWAAAKESAIVHTRLPIIPPPAPWGVIDGNIAQLDLPPGNGFANMLTLAETDEALMRLDTLFFV
jgi:hypothetical protein